MIKWIKGLFIKDRSHLKNRTETQKIFDRINYHIERQLEGKPMPELRITREAKDKYGKVYWQGFGWWYPSDWDFEIGGRK